VRAIVKAAEPTSLTEHRLTPHSGYANYAAKDDLRANLVAEQRGLCCYCMGRIRVGHSSMKIEHWRCQANYPVEQLNYRNLLGGCTGGKGQPTDQQHCDTRKGNADLQWNPAEPAHRIEIQIKYELDGTIRSANPVFDGQLNEVLNLNLPQIRNNRKGVLTALLDWWNREKGRLRGPVSRVRIEHEIDVRTNGTGELSPYCQVAVWWLKQKLVRMAR
jgi:uncharacterized protein (TIGR02646 family)